MTDGNNAPRLAAGPPIGPRETACALDAADVRTLAEIGFLAATTGHPGLAQTIFAGLDRARPDRAFAKLGLAVTWIYAGRAAEAVALLEHVTGSDEEERATLAAWLGMALQLAGHAGRGRQILEVAARACNAAGALARSLLAMGHAQP